MKTQDNCRHILATTVERVVQSPHEIGLPPHVNIFAHHFEQSHGRGVYFPAMPTHIGERDTGYEIVTADRDEMKIAVPVAHVKRN